MNHNNKCNNYGTCSECKNKYWMGEMIKLENWPEKGSLCRECLVKIKIPCGNCAKFFNKIEDFSEWERKNYEQHEKVDRKKWNETNPAEEIFWPYIGCHYYIKGGQFCHQADCRGHFVPQHGHYCSEDCQKEAQGGVADRNSKKYLEWKAWAEKKGWTPCQEKDLFWDWDNHPKLSVYKEKIRKKEGDQALACDKMAAPGEKYCFYCECERKDIKWGSDHRNNEKNYVKSYRDYWNLTSDENDWSNNNQENSSKNSLSVSYNDDNKIEKLEKELIEAKRQRKSPEEIKKLQSELEKLSNHQPKKEIKPTKNNNNSVLVWSVGIFGVSTLVLGIILIVKRNKKK